MGIEQDVMIGAWTLPDRDRGRGFPGIMEHRGKALPSVIGIALYGLATLCAQDYLPRSHGMGSRVASSSPTPGRVSISTVIGASRVHYVILTSRPL
jgi:hypothetical protein